MMGDLDTNDALCRDLSVASGASVVSVDYRLATEFPFPAAIEDGLAALSWLHSSAKSILGTDRLAH